MSRLMITALAALSFCAGASSHRFDGVEIESQKITEGIYMLTGAGGNIGVSAGADGILIIDDQFAPLAEKIEAALAELSPKPVRYVINTHVHGDHVGGNSHFGKTATIFAHQQVLRRLAEDEELPREALPVVTYADGVQFHFNGTVIEVLHLPTGHTDGDSVIWFREANVVHMGDLMFNGMFPFIDLGRGGTVNGFLANIRQLHGQMDDQTRIIPGHGPLATKVDLTRTIAMLEQSISWMTAQKSAGKTLGELRAGGVPEALKPWAWKFIGEEKWIQTLYMGLP